MACFPSSRSQLLIVLVTGGIAFTAIVVDSSPAPTTGPPNKAAIEVYPSCKKTFMPKRCSVKLSALSKSLADTKATIAGPPISTNNKLKSDGCVTDCAKVLDTTASKVAGDVAPLKEYLYPLVISNYGPIGPCECNCPEPCTPDESAAVKKLGNATAAMRDMADMLTELLDDQSLTNKEKKAKGAAMEKSIDSGVLHVSCGLTKEPQKCVDELAALRKTMAEATDVAYDKLGRSSRLNVTIQNCAAAMSDLAERLSSAETKVSNLADLRASLRSYVQGEDGGNKPPPCKTSCPPPPPPCSANETAVVDKLNAVYDAWIAADKFLTQLLPPN